MYIFNFNISRLNDIKYLKYIYFFYLFFKASINLFK